MKSSDSVSLPQKEKAFVTNSKHDLPLIWVTLARTIRLLALPSLRFHVYFFLTSCNALTKLKKYIQNVEMKLNEDKLRCLDFYKIANEVASFSIEQR